MRPVAVGALYAASVFWLDDPQERHRSLERQASMSWGLWRRVQCNGRCLGRVGLDRPEQPNSCSAWRGFFGKGMTAVIEPASI